VPAVRELKIALEEAQKAHAAIERQREQDVRAEVDRIKAEIGARYKPSLDTAATAVRAAREAWEAAATAEVEAQASTLDQTVLCEWGRERSWHPLRATGRRGRLAICAPEDRFNKTWNTPEIGERFIRILKKDGSDALAFDRVKFGGSERWLPEGQEPKAEAKES
jgi:hypothetical protein